ncbi:MAG TPA: UDP-N-acetylmuramoyl-tripeptide--D-alanyl-D-alanine ligase [Bacillota bacterium]|nr:UDP-N-acetylmuramoyl-tripeptide--D-alanyl-D-alanine ligase [Bacillota bacterium]
MLYSTRWLATIFPNNEGKISDNQIIESVSIDSRNIEGRTLFVPIVGENFNGHDFVEDAITKGAIAFFWDKSYDLPVNIPNDVAIFYVNDTIDALQLLAKEHRKKINPFVVGITGSNGKTTTKDIVTAVINTSFKTYGTKGNFNNHIGLPLTIVNMPTNTEVLVLEMGMNDFGEIEQLSRLAEPDIGIIVNIGESHIEFLKSREGIAKAKLEIVSGLKEDGYLIVDGDEPLLQHLHEKPCTITCGYEQNNDVVISNVNQKSLTETTFQLTSGEKYTLPLVGTHNVLNASFAIAIGKRLKIKPKTIQQGLNNLQLTSMRMEFSQGQNGVTIINDAYNASPTSMRAAINIVKQLDEYSTKVLVLGDILELGDYGEQFHKDVAKTINRPISAVITYGELSQIISNHVAASSDMIETEHFTEADQLIDHLQQYLNEDTVILFKASRSMYFENLVKAIQ